MNARVLVVAKSPVPGDVKTRLGADIGMEEAARVAAAALIDTLTACSDAVGPRHCYLSLAGDLDSAVRRDELVGLLDGWTVTPQVGTDFGGRLVRAHFDVDGGPVVQIGMDTPQVTSSHLAEAADGLAEHDAVLGPAEDGGWWALALRDPSRAAALLGVPMSTPTTYDDTRSALLATGTSVGVTTSLRDVDTVADADAVADLAPGGEFARAWSDVWSDTR